MRNYSIVAAVVIHSLVVANEFTVVQEVASFRLARASEFMAMQEDTADVINSQEDYLYHIEDEPLEEAIIGEHGKVEPQKGYLATFTSRQLQPSVGVKFLPKRMLRHVAFAILSGRKR